MLATQEHIDKAINRAEAMLARARIVNAGQYAHGINSTSATIECHIRSFKRRCSPDFQGSPDAKGVHYDGLNILHDKVMQLGGYLYALKEGMT